MNTVVYFVTVVAMATASIIRQQDEVSRAKRAALLPAPVRRAVKNPPQIELNYFSGELRQGTDSEGMPVSDCVLVVEGEEMGSIQYFPPTSSPQAIQFSLGERCYSCSSCSVSQGRVAIPCTSRFC